MAMYTWNLKLRYKEVVKGKVEKSRNIYNRNGIRTNDKNRTTDSPVTANSQKRNLAINKTQNSKTAAGSTSLKD